MSYTLNGSFIEACDCYIVCPCWVDEEADDGHCTGLVAWTLGAGSTIGTTPVHDRKVVSAFADVLEPIADFQSARAVLPVTGL